VSILNRKKLFEGLARIKVLGFFSFQRLYPQASKVIVNASADCVFVIGGKTTRVPAGERKEITSGAHAGDRVVVTKKKDTLPLSFTAEFEFEEGSLSVSGADTTDKQARITFIVPLPRPWDYAKPINDAFGLDTSTSGVSSYPDCR